MNDLLFQFPQDYSTDLVFGAYVDELTTEATVAITLPAMTFSAVVVPTVEGELAATFPALSLDADAEYNSRAERPTVSAAATDWQVGVRTAVGSLSHVAVALPLEVGGGSSFQQAAPLESGVEAKKPKTLEACRTDNTAPHGNAIRAAASLASRYDDALRDRRASRSAHHQDAVRVGVARSSASQDGLRDRRSLRQSGFSEALRAIGRRYAWAQTSGRQTNTPAGSLWQMASRPPAGIYTVPPVIPPSAPCYTPNPQLLFSSLADGTGNLLFICDNAVEQPSETIVIPVRRVYLMVNETSLVRVVGNFPIAATDLSVAFDADSWLATFSASIPEAARDAVMPDPSPVEVVATINGTAIHFLVEKITRNRAFGKRSVSISGSGIACELDSPYAPVTQHLNTGDRTAQQLITDALQFTGYDLTWGITDWLVPAGVFSLAGTPAGVAKNVAEAAGAVLAADWTQRRLRLLPRYPVKPWNWATATPDYVIPGAVTQTESLEWLEYPSYNAVYVSGVQSGILGHVKVTGTAGDIVAPMVSHPLITHADAARQRGTAILGNTGRKTRMQISLPVLPESGIIDVCKLIEFSDGTNTRRGIVRGNRIQDSRPIVRQTLTIEASA